VKVKSNAINRGLICVGCQINTFIKPTNCIKVSLKEYEYKQTAVKA